jgi:hypothetical protein
MIRIIQSGMNIGGKLDFIIIVWEIQKKLSKLLRA